MKFDHRQGRPASAAALRVLGRLRGLRRDALPQADHPALRRSRRDRQRHRLLLASTAATCRPHRGAPNAQGRGPAWAQLALRGQRGVRPRHAAVRSTSTPSTRVSCWSDWRHDCRRRLVDALLNTDQSDRGRHRQQRELRRGAQAKAAPRSGSRELAGARPAQPGRLAGRRASGSWAATAGPTTSALAASIT